MATILVVEDDADIRQLITFTLTHDGFEAVEAATAEEAWAHLDKTQPAAILLDLMLPDMDGISLCETFRKLPRTANTPILMITAWATVQARMLGHDAGADDYITKPFSPRDMIRRLRQAIDRRAPVAA